MSLLANITRYQVNCFRDIKPPICRGATLTLRFPIIKFSLSLVNSYGLKPRPIISGIKTLNSLVKQNILISHGYSTVEFLKSDCLSKTVTSKTLENISNFVSTYRRRPKPDNESRTSKYVIIGRKNVGHANNDHRPQTEEKDRFTSELVRQSGAD